MSESANNLAGSGAPSSRSGGWADLHMHTNFSDGSLSPEELLRIAHEIGLQALAITDHDTVGGLASATEWAERFGIELVPAIELGTHVGDTEFHFLGYFIDPENAALLEYLRGIRITRKNRAAAILQKLASFGLKLKLDEVLERAGQAAVGRPHIAAAMVENGLVSSFQEAFDLWIGDGKPAHVNKGQYTPEALIELIHAADGIAVLAHPGRRLSNGLLQRMVSAGLDGLEVLHPSHDGATQNRLKQMAQKYGLLMTGGSDFHAFRGSQNVIGNYIIPYKIVEQLKNYKVQRDRDPS